MKSTYYFLVLLFSVMSIRADILSSLSPYLSSSRNVYDPDVMDPDLDILNPRYAPFSPADSDLGVQQILGAYDGLPPVDFRFDTSINHTNNSPDNTPTRESAAWFWAGQLDINWNPRIAYGWFLDVGLGQGVYRFDDSPESDFENFEGYVGVVKSIPELDDLLFFVRYENQQINAHTFNRDYSANRIRTGFRKSLITTTRHQLSAGVDAAFDINANLDELKRNQYSADVRYTYWFGDKLSSTISWTGSRWDFDQFGREDWNHVVSLEIRWSPSDNFSIFTNIAYTDHESNVDPFSDNFSALQSGLGFGINYSF
jgi:hypothetical protein